MPDRYTCYTVTLHITMSLLGGVTLHVLRRNTCNVTLHWTENEENDARQ